MIDFDKFQELLSAYFDDELGTDILEEIEELIDEDDCCECLFNTFRKTVDICRCVEPMEVPEDVHQELHRFLRMRIVILEDIEDED